MHALFARHAEALERVIARVCHRGRVRDRRDDFAQEVRLHFLRKPHIFAGFRGHCQIDSYLYQVVWNCYLNWLAHERGRWRPSINARALGPTAVSLQRYVERDHLTEADAIHLLIHQGVASLDELTRIAGTLSPSRRRRAVMVPLPERLERACPDHRPDARAPASAARTAAWLGAALRQLAPEDRAMIWRRFCVGESAVAIGVAMHMAPRHVYARLNSVLRWLRTEAGKAGIDRTSVVEALDFRLLADVNVIEVAADAERRTQNAELGPVQARLRLGV